MHWRYVVDVLVQPIDVFRGVRERPAVLVALIVTGLSQLAWGMGGAEVYPGIAVNAFGAIIVAVLGLLLVALFIHGFARLMRGESGYWNAVSALGVATTPTLLYAPVYVLAATMQWVGLAVMGMIAFSIWALVLHVLAMREVYQLSTGRAVAAIVLGYATPFLAVMILAIVLGIVIGLGAMVMR